MEARRITDYPNLTFANLHAVIEQTIAGGSYRADAEFRLPVHVKIYTG